MVIGIGGTIDPFHTQVDMALMPYLRLKIITLPSIRDSILAIIAKYVLDPRFLIQPDPYYICWIYQQVFMYNLSIQSFLKYCAV